MPKISIIIPAYNSIDHIHETVECLLKQTHKSIEIIIIDDGSSDNIKTTFPGFKKQGIICITQENSGASTARNKGLEIATGDYIQFLDADDLIHPLKLETQLKNMIDHDADLSFSLWSSFSNAIETNPKVHYKHDYKKPRTGPEMLSSMGMDGWFIPIHSWLIKKELIQKAGFWNPNIYNNDDGEYFSRILSHCQKVICIDKHYAFYRTSGDDSLSKLNSESKISSAFNSWKLIHALMATFNNNNMLVYPQRAYFILFEETIITHKRWAKLFAAEFDKINHIIAYPHITQFPLYNYLIKYLGLYKGVSFYNVIAKVRNLFTK